MNSAIAAEKPSKSSAVPSDVKNSQSKQGHYRTSAISDKLCSDFTVPIYAIYSKRKIEEVIIELLSKNYQEFGDLHWACIVHKFEQQDARLKVKIHKDVVNPKGVPPLHPDKDIVKGVYRFTVVRSWNIFALLLSFGPGASNGVFTAIVNLTSDGRVAVIQRGGKEKWLTFE